MAPLQNQNGDFDIRPDVLDLTDETHWWRFESEPKFDSPDPLNRPEHFSRANNFTTRRIEGSVRVLRQDYKGPTRLVVGTNRPPIYLNPNQAMHFLKQEEENTRWILQNSACAVVLPRVIIEDDAPQGPASVKSALVAARQIIKVNARDLPNGPPWFNETEWLVRAVRHSWDDVSGYRQSIECTMWQGPFRRFSPED